MDWGLPASSVYKILQQEYWNGLPFPSPGGLSNPGIETASPAWEGRFFTTEPPEKHKSHAFYSVSIYLNIAY